MILLGEKDYLEKLQHTVRPVLEDNRKAGYFSSYDGEKIFFEYYEHPQEKASVVISHGFCEFTKKFEEVIYYFYQQGYSVYISDHRGHGYSVREIEDKSKVFIRSYEDYVQDFYQFITKVVFKDKVDKKLILYAHSMGGAIAALFLEQYPDVFLGAILSSPMLEIECGKTPTIIVQLVMQYKKLIGAEKEFVSGHGPFDGVPHFESSSCLSAARYNNIFSERLQDENYQTWGGTCAWTLASIKAVRRLQRYADRVKLPILLFQAGMDTTVRPSGQKRFANRSANTHLVEMSDSKHEIYNATTEIRDAYYKQIFAFFDKLLGNCLN